MSSAVAAIGEDGAEPIAKPFLADLFFHLLYTAQFDVRGTSCFLRRHAGTNIFIGQHCEVGTNLLVEVFLKPASGKEISHETSGFHKERHVGHLYDASKA